MARTMERRVSSASLLTLAAAALLVFFAEGCSAQRTANRHTLRYDGEVNIGERGRQKSTLTGKIYRSIGAQISLGLSSVARPSNSADC